MAQAVRSRDIDGVQVPEAGTWEIDPAHSSVTFVARHLVVAKVRGKFGAFSGTLHIAQTPQESWAEVSIEANSIDTGVQQRDEHLRSADFLAAERYPTLRFRSTALEPAGRWGFKLTGDLTIRDVTKQVELEVELDGVGPDPWGGTRAAFSAHGEIDRDEFGVSWNQALETGGFVVGKKVRIEIEIEAVRAGD